MRKALIGMAVAGALAGGAVVGDRRTIERWRRNPDPLEGRPAVFPPGDRRAVGTDDGAEISTITAGEGPTVVLVHGLTGNTDQWGPVAERLIASGHRVVGVDQRGHGASTTGSGGFGGQRLGADLVTVLETLDLHDIVLAGHSMGGMAAMSLAADRPDVLAGRVSALGLVATSASLQTPRYQLGLRLASAAPLDPIADLSRQLRLGAGLTAFGRRPSLFMVDEVLRSFHRCPDPVRRAANAALVDFDVSERIGSIDLPTLVLCGDRDQITPPSSSRLIAGTIPGAHLELIEDAGHMVIWEHADRTAALLAELASNFAGPSRSAV